MRKNILIFGLISGLIVSTLMGVSMILCYRQETMEGSMLLGYSFMVLSFSLIFVGIKNYRDKYNGGTISYGKAFTIGILITLIASTCYVITWAVLYHNFMPDFMDKYSAHTLRSAKANGASALELQKMGEDLAAGAKAYQNPLVFTAYTLAEIFPVGLLITLITAAFLKRKTVQI